MTAEAIEKGAAARRGRKLSPEHVEKIRRRMKGSTMPPEVRAKISAANKGRKLTAADKLKRSMVAISQERGRRLNARIKDDPELAAQRRENARSVVALIAERRRAGEKPKALLRLRRLAAATIRKGGRVAPSPAPHIVGFVPDYRANAVVFFRP